MRAGWWIEVDGDDEIHAGPRHSRRTLCGRTATKVIAAVIASAHKPVTCQECLDAGAEWVPGETYQSVVVPDRVE